MDDLAYGTRDKRGNWKPSRKIDYPPVFVWPARPAAFVKWLFGYPGYILPWNLFYTVLAVAIYLYATPSIETTRSFAPGWIAFILVRNLAIVLVFFGAFHVRLYVRQAQGTRFKYNPKFPDSGGEYFLFKSQTADNMIWTLGSGVPIWTAWEAVTLWLFANGYIPYVSFAEHPVYCVALFLLIPVIRDLHFYLVHRLIHVPFLYRWVHKLHHNNVNPGPWSGLAMHPVEHFLYFSVVVAHWIIPSHPVHAIFTLLHAGLAPAPGHAGFDKVELGADRAIDIHTYEHYLHHKYFECNYSDGVVPLDKWFGTFHDGSAAAQERMDTRFMERARRKAEKHAKGT